MHVKNYDPDQTASSLGLHCLSRHFCCYQFVFEILEHLPYIFLSHEFCSLHAGQFCMLFVVFSEHSFRNIIRVSNSLDPDYWLPA